MTEQPLPELDGGDVLAPVVGIEADDLLTVVSVDGIPLAILIGTAKQRVTSVRALRARFPQAKTTEVLPGHSVWPLLKAQAR